MGAYAPGVGGEMSRRLRTPVGSPTAQASEDSRTGSRSRTWFALRVLVTISLMGGMVYLADLSQVGAMLDRWAAFGLLGASLALTVTLHLSAIRWQVVLGQSAPDVIHLSRLYFIGWFFSQFLPSSVGGDAARLAGLKFNGIGLGRGGSSILLERLLGLVALLAFLAVGIIVFPALAFQTAEGSTLGLSTRWLLAIAVTGLGGGGALVWLGRRSARVHSLLKEVVGLWQGFVRSPKRVAYAGILSVLVQTGYIATWIVLAWGLGLEIPFLVYFFFVPAVSLAALLPVTVSGLGVREGFTFLALSPLGVGLTEAVTYGLSFYASSLIVGGIGGVAFLRSGLAGAGRRDGDGRPESPYGMTDRRDGGTESLSIHVRE